MPCNNMTWLSRFHIFPVSHEILMNKILQTTHNIEANLILLLSTPSTYKSDRNLSCAFRTSLYDSKLFRYLSYCRLYSKVLFSFKLNSILYVFPSLYNSWFYQFNMPLSYTFENEFYPLLYITYTFILYVFLVLKVQT